MKTKLIVSTCALILSGNVLAQASMGSGVSVQPGVGSGVDSASTTLPSTVPYGSSPADSSFQQMEDVNGFNGTTDNGLSGAMGGAPAGANPGMGPGGTPAGTPSGGSAQGSTFPGTPSSPSVGPNQVAP